MAVENAVIAGLSHTDLRQVQPKSPGRLAEPLQSQPANTDDRLAMQVLQELLSSLTNTAGLIGVLLEIHLFTKHPMFA